MERGTRTTNLPDAESGVKSCAVKAGGGNFFNGHGLGAWAAEGVETKSGPSEDSFAVFVGP